MNTPPPLPAEMQEKIKSFTLPPLAWLVWMVAAGLILWIALSGPGPLSAREQGRVIGQMVALLLFPVLLGWVVWRVGKRSLRAGLTAFYVVLALSFFGQLGQGLDRRRQLVVVEKMDAMVRESRDELRASIEKDGVITPESQTRVVDRAFAALSDAVSNTKGEDREVALGMQAFIEWAKSCQVRQAAAIHVLQIETFFDLAQHATPEQRAQKSKGVGELKEANAQLREFVENGSAWIERELRQRQVGPAKIQSVLAGYADSANNNRPILLSIRASEESFADLLDNFIAFAAKHEGQWSLEEGTGALLLPSDEAVAEYNRLIERAQVIGQEQLELQRQLLAPKP